MKIYTFKTGYNNIHNCDTVEDFLHIDEVIELIGKEIRENEEEGKRAISQKNTELIMYNQGCQNALKSILDRIEELL